MNIRKLRENWSDSPATYTIGGLWLLVYFLMMAGQWLGVFPYPGKEMTGEMGPLGIGAISEVTGQSFGAWSASEILAGQIWRTILATFVHFGAIHIALNLFGMLQLGQLVEQWYGPRLTLAIIITIGFFGNGLAALARPVFGQPTPYLLEITSGGGSTVVFGLIGLVAMVGKRSRSRMGRYLYNQMVGLLVFNFLIGMTIPQIDNYAHAGGAIAGAIIGRFHHTLLGWMDTRAKLCQRVLQTTVLILLACVICQVRVYRIQSEIREIQTRLTTLEKAFQSLNQLRVGYVNRTILGLHTYQMIHQKPRLNLTWFQPMLIAMPDQIIEDNRMRLNSTIDQASAIFSELNSPALNPLWNEIRAEARRAVSRPPHAKEIQPMINRISQIDQVMIQLSQHYIKQAKTVSDRLVFWQMPWPGVVWHDGRPLPKALANKNLPINGLNSPNRHLPNGPALLPDRPR